MESSEIKLLINLMSKIPGLGPRSARRAVLSLIQNPQKKLIPLADSMLKTAKQIKLCNVCGIIDVKNPCSICSDSKRNNEIICIVEEIGDLWAIERSGIYKGKYHILGGVLSAIDGISAEDLRINQLIDHVTNIKAQEVILAMSATVAGQTTSYYVLDILKKLDLKVTKLAHGMPMGCLLYTSPSPRDRG